MAVKLASVAAALFILGRQRKPLGRPAPKPCGLSPRDWCASPPGDPCGRRANERECRADPACEGMRLPRRVGRVVHPRRTRLLEQLPGRRLHQPTAVRCTAGASRLPQAPSALRTMSPVSRCSAGGVLRADTCGGPFAAHNRRLAANRPAAVGG